MRVQRSQESRVDPVGQGHKERDYSVWYSNTRLFQQALSLFITQPCRYLFLR